MYLAFIAFANRSLRVAPKFIFSFVRLLQLFFSALFLVYFYPLIILSPVFMYTYFKLSKLSIEVEKKPLSKSKRILILLYSVFTLTFIIQVAFYILGSSFIEHFEVGFGQLELY
jgi:hypothetical protein